jgi:hypothetical protein
LGGDGKRNIFVGGAGQVLVICPSGATGGGDARTDQCKMIRDRIGKSPAAIVVCPQEASSHGAWSFIEIHCCGGSTSVVPSGDQILQCCETTRCAKRRDRVSKRSPTDATLESRRALRYDRHRKHSVALDRRAKDPDHQ